VKASSWCSCWKGLASGDGLNKAADIFFLEIHVDVVWF